jgi:hypothetical protein
VADHRLRLGAGEQPQRAARCAATAAADAAPHRVPAIGHRSSGDPRYGRAGRHRWRGGDRDGAAGPGQRTGDLATGGRPRSGPPRPLRPGPGQRDEERPADPVVTVAIEFRPAVVDTAHVVGELVTTAFAYDTDTVRDHYADADTFDVDPVIAVIDTDDAEPELLVDVDLGYPVSPCSAMLPPGAPSP